ncbi:MAG: ATPase, partial [Erysipelotrichia bacterium]|nr:ATPase [Erysipelotrichia bacterium]
ESLKLFTLKSLKPLVEEINEKELLPCVGKKY